MPSGVYERSEKCKITQFKKGQIPWNKSNYVFVDKTCLNCGKIMKRKNDKTSFHFKRRKYCSLPCMQKKNLTYHMVKQRPHRSDDTKQKLRIARIKQGFVVISMPHGMVLSHLSDLGIHFDFEKGFMINGKYHPFDIIIDDKYIEIDGCYYHGCLDENCNVGGKNNLKKGLDRKQLNIIKRDKEIQKYCKENNVKLLIIKEHDLMNDFEGTVRRIIEWK
jgi:hypothetical protein